MLRSLFNVERSVPVQPVPDSNAEMPSFDVAPGLPPAAAIVQREGVFVTPQSLVSFAGATGAVTIIWQALGALRPAWRGDLGVAMAISIVIGAAIYLISETDPMRAPVSAQQRIVGLFIAAINSFVLFSAAVGTSSIAT